MNESDFKDIVLTSHKELYSSAHIVSGVPIPKTKRIELFSPDEWERFAEEWASSLRDKYYKVSRYGGAGDKGLDVVGFVNDGAFIGGWDNYQCKYYDHPLCPSDIWVEVGKVIYYSFIREHPTTPRKYYFVAPKEIGTTLGKLIAKPLEFKNETRKNWDKHVKDKISSSFSVELDGKILRYFDDFDFSIFDSTSLVDMINGHSKTPFHSVLFGGGLVKRPTPEIPPPDRESVDSLYIKQILYAYSEHEKEEVKDLIWLNNNEKYKKDFNRQRERFYHAEALRNFSRDNVPPGTYEQLQEDIYQGIVDTCESDHIDGLERMKATITQAAALPIEASPLSSVTRPADKQGICHQLVDNGKIRWVDVDE